MIAIHGLTRNSADFDAIAPLIAQSGRRVLAVDIRGRGQSDRAPDPMTYQPATYAQDILALMNQTGIERAVFLGTSMGCMHIFVWAETHPDFAEAMMPMACQPWPMLATLAPMLLAAMMTTMVTMLGTARMKARW